MIVKLTRAARIPHEAGETVKVSPDFANILFSQGAAVIVTDGEKEETTGDAPEETTGDAPEKTTGDAPAPKNKKTKKKE